MARVADIIFLKTAIIVSYISCIFIEGVWINFKMYSSLMWSTYENRTIFEEAF